MNRTFIIFLILFLSLFQQKVFCQFTEFHPELNWRTIEGDHFAVHYHEEAERTARTVLKIAEEVYGPITSLYHYQPDKVHFVIKDIDDYSNGATYFFDNKIEIWASALDFDLRGTHNWLRNVISHEFTHMVQIQASLKLSRAVPAVYLQFLNYEDKRRPDILYGFPNVIVSYPLSTINVPAWFAEGTAQYMRKEFNYDHWDSHRDMILRSYALDGNMLSWNQMGEFGKTSLGNESVYNSGFSLISFIAHKYGEDKLSKINDALRNFSVYTIDAAFKKALGKDGDEVYNEWKTSVTADYKKRTTDLISNTSPCDTLVSEGFGNFYPIYSPDGKKVLYISNKSEDYFSLSSVYMYDLESKKDKLIQSGIRSSLSFIPGTNKIIYSKLSENNKGWANIHDIYEYDIDKKEENRLTSGLRANNPSVSNDGKYIVFVFQKDGTSNLGLVDIKGQNFKRLTFYENGEQVYNPKFSYNDSLIVFDYSYANGRDIACVKPDGSGLKFILNTECDERNGVVTKDNELYYSCDESGIFNIYSYNLVTGVKNQHTNVIGGAFMPAVADNGDILYSGYTSKGYKIFRIKNDSQKKIDITKRYLPAEPVLSADASTGSSEIDGIRNLVKYNDYDVPKYESKPYKGAFTNLTFYPFLRIDNYTTSNDFTDRIKPGVYVTSTDMLDRYSLFAGGAINKRWERDLFFILQYRNKLPLLFNLGIRPELSLELYSVSRKANTELLLGENDVNGNIQYDQRIPVDVTYDLFEVDLAAKHRIFSRGNDIEFRFIYSDYTSMLNDFIFRPQDGSPDQLIPSSKSKYLVSRNFQIKFTHEIQLPQVDDDINPVGSFIELLYNYELNKFNPTDSLKNENGLLKPIYSNYNFHRLELNWREHIPIWDRHTLTTTLRLGSILGPTVPDFFDYYLGGLVGMKAYPFYAISGNEVAWLNLTYRFPLFRNIDYRLGMLYLDKIYLSFHGDFGNAWNGKVPDIGSFKKGAGTEIRFQLNSFYLFPTSVFFDASYAFDRYDRVVKFLGDQTVSYGKQWQFYGGVMFDFSF